MTTRSPIPGIYWLGDLEIALGERGRTILANRLELEAQGFPTPLPRLKPNSRFRWRAAEVEEWIAAHRCSAPMAANDGGPARPGDGAEARRLSLISAL
jgi:hypothetical protein